MPLGFVVAAAACALAHPTVGSILIGCAVAVPGELIRVWAAGHIDKGREVTTSGPYQFVRHPLYVGSAIMGLGFAIASASLLVAWVVVIYLGVTFGLAIRAEEAALSGRFGHVYDEYRSGQGPAARRPWQFSRMMANREYRAVAGFVIGFGLLYLRMFVP